MKSIPAAYRFNLPFIVTNGEPLHQSHDDGIFGHKNFQNEIVLAGLALTVARANGALSMTCCCSILPQKTSL